MDSRGSSSHPVLEMWSFVNEVGNGRYLSTHRNPEEFKRKWEMEAKWQVLKII